MNKSDKTKKPLNKGNCVPLIPKPTESQNSCKNEDEQEAQQLLMSKKKHKKSIEEEKMQSEINSCNKNHIFEDKKEYSNMKYNLPKVTVTLTDFLKSQLKKNSNGVNVYQDENGHSYKIFLNKGFDNTEMSSEVDGEKTKFKETNVSHTLGEGFTNKKKDTRNLKKKANKRKKALFSSKKRSNLKIPKSKKNNSRANSHFLNSELCKSNVFNTVKKANRSSDKINSNYNCNYEKKLEDLLDESLLKNLKGRNVFNEFLKIFSDLHRISTYSTKGITSLSLLENKKKMTIQLNVDLESFEKISLNAILNDIMKNDQVPSSEIVSCLKEGLCFNFLENNYSSTKEQSYYQHKPSEWFFLKMKNYSYELIMTIVILMRKDILFVDVVTAAFKILSEKNFVLWTTILVFFVYYVIDTSEEVFLAFWVNAARFFGNSENGCKMENGISCLLHIFRGGGDKTNIKIHKFIKLVKQLPLPLSYKLLQPVIKMNLPSQFLIEVVEFSIKTQKSKKDIAGGRGFKWDYPLEKDVLKVYEEVIPEISFETMSLDVFELLLKFCKMMEILFPENSTYNLKQKLQTKVHTFYVPIPENKYPYTSSFLREITSNSADSNFKNHESIPQWFIEKVQTNDYCNTENLENHINSNFKSCINKTPTNALQSNRVPKLAENAIPFSNTEIHFGEQALRLDMKRKILNFLKNCEFVSLNTYLNDISSDILKPVAEYILGWLFKMKISLRNVVYLIKILLICSNGEKSSRILASITITLILNLVKIREWEKAYMIFCICSKKQINLVQAMVLPLIGLPPISEFRVALVLVEICIYNKNYEKAMYLIKKYYLYSLDLSLCELTWEKNDEDVRVQILEKVIEQTIRNYATEAAYDLFILIYSEQKQFQKPFDLRKFANEILILMLNQNSEEAIKMYYKIQSEGMLKDITVRAVIVTMVRHNRLQEAKNILTSLNQNIYFVPDVTFRPVVMISNSWLDEEIYVIFDQIFDLLANRYNYGVFNKDNLSVYINLSMGDKYISSKTLFRYYNTPICLSLVKPGFRRLFGRIKRVLENRFSPSILLQCTSGTLKLDNYTLNRHLCYRNKMVKF